MSYESFAAGAVKYGLSFAIKCAAMYKTPIDVTLSYVRRFPIEGYTV